MKREVGDAVDRGDALELGEPRLEHGTGRLDAALAGDKEAHLIGQFTAQADAVFQAILDDIAAPSPDLAALGRRYQQALAQDYFDSEVGMRVRAALLRVREDEV